MKLTKAVWLAILGWTVSITSLHAWLNLGVFARKGTDGPAFRVGFLPVT